MRFSNLYLIGTTDLFTVTMPVKLRSGTRRNYKKMATAGEESGSEVDVVGVQSQNDLLPEEVDASGEESLV